MTKKTIIRVQKRPGEFALIHKGFLADARLGLDAMGLLAWMLAKPDDWKHHVDHIAGSTGTALNRVRSSMQMLVNCGYVRRRRVTDRNNGRVIRWEMTVFETPASAQTAEQEQPLLFEKMDPGRAGRPKGVKNSKPHFQPDIPDVDFPHSGKPETGYPDAGNPEGGECNLLRTNGTNIESTKQRRTNGATSAASDRLSAGAGGSVVCVATPETAASTGVDVASVSVVVGSEDEIVSSLVRTACFPLGEARKLIEQHGTEACRRGLACLVASKRVPGNRRGFVVRAIQSRWEPSSGTGRGTDDRRIPPREVEPAPNRAPGAPNTGVNYGRHFS